MKGAPTRNEEREPAWLYGAGRSVCRRGGLQSCFAYAKARAVTACLYSVDAAGSIRQLSDRTSSALAHFEPFSCLCSRRAKSPRSNRAEEAHAAGAGTQRWNQARGRGPWTSHEPRSEEHT